MVMAAFWNGEGVVSTGYVFATTNMNTPTKILKTYTRTCCSPRTQSSIEQCEVDKKHSIARSCVVSIQITVRVPPSNLRAHLHTY